MDAAIARLYAAFVPREPAVSSMNAGVCLLLVNLFSLIFSLLFLSASASPRHTGTEDIRCFFLVSGSNPRTSALHESLQRLRGSTLQRLNRLFALPSLSSVRSFSRPAPGVSSRLRFSLRREMSLLRKSILLFGHSGALGGAVAEAFAAARYRVIGCSPRARSKRFESGIFSVGGASPHATIEIESDSRSLQEQSEQLASKLQPLLADGPPLHAAICCSGAFAQSPVSSEDFLAEAESLIRANCFPSLLCAHTAAVIFRNRSKARPTCQDAAFASQDTALPSQDTAVGSQDTAFASQDTLPPLVVLTGAGAVSATAPTPEMIGYGCSKVFVHHLVRSLAASAAKEESAARERSRLNAEEEKRERLDFRVAGILPVTLDTPANRSCMHHVTDEEKKDSWTSVEVVAEQLVKWMEGEDPVENGGLYVVKTEKGKTHFLLNREI
ncbi:6,7-dihydropteridine reductase [Toxoplasma gondii ME49]|uniref:6,7-dihydropteridine reductase n=1 Tax=Toxoplasma gondii (strain ATCC 50611 / Me49) TaxID=508771 RepID=S8F5I5_TOXGM|nr:6,7-dihydropteridine reductase [Toxoplasma gondii ME49]EPT31081.1 6,7-dihydropteridine reductase [Toxoplasma gondii ME49]|eukprot:XP_002369213.2 6,7-dihydropteridine reductase [Toxoplasma gondii ME49]